MDADRKEAVLSASIGVHQRPENAFADFSGRLLALGKVF
jgi:hypothetical protein